MRTITVREFFTHRTLKGQQRTPFIHLRCKWLREHGLNPGDKLQVFEQPGGVLLIRKAGE